MSKYHDKEKHIFMKSVHIKSDFRYLDKMTKIHAFAAAGVFLGVAWVTIWFYCA